MSDHDEYDCPNCAECPSCDGGSVEQLPKRWTLVGIGIRCDDCDGEGLVCTCSCHPVDTSKAAS